MAPDEFDCRDEEQKVQDSKAAIQNIKNALELHALPPTQLGFGAS